MSFLESSDIRNKFSIQPNRYDTQIDAAIESARLVIEQSVEADTYAEALDEAAEPPTLRYSSVVEAHSYLTMYFLVGNVGNKLADAGFVKSQQDSASPASNSRVITNAYLTPKEIQDMRNSFLSLARSALGAYGTIVIETISVEPIAYSATAVTVTSDW